MLFAAQQRLLGDRFAAGEPSRFEEVARWIPRASTQCTCFDDWT